MTCNAGENVAVDIHRIAGRGGFYSDRAHLFIIYELRALSAWALHLLRGVPRLKGVPGEMR
jgi:hypothetical protein